MAKTILVTGASGMIGTYLVKELLSQGHSVIGVDRRSNEFTHDRYRFCSIDLGDLASLQSILHKYKVDRVIHLAALAHRAGEADLSFERYRHINVECAENVFKAAEEANLPVLFISTVDVLGFVKGLISPATKPNPVSNYGKSKAMAEESLKRICSHYDIYRFSPVYTKDVKRDIQKRYYLKEPNLAYRIGKGETFEVLDVNGAVKAMVDWVALEPKNSIRVIKDEKLLDVNDLINQEKAAGRAKHVLNIPRWMVLWGYYLLRPILGKTNKTYLIYKALWPFRTTN